MAANDTTVKWTPLFIDDLQVAEATKSTYGIKSAGKEILANGKYYDHTQAPVTTTMDFDTIVPIEGGQTTADQIRAAILQRKVKVGQLIGGLWVQSRMRLLEVSFDQVSADGELKGSWKCAGGLPQTSSAF
jgi:hypothetical protein